MKIVWTEEAKKSVQGLPTKVIENIFDKVGSLRLCDPRKVHKPLVGPLAKCRSIKCGRYRVLYMVKKKSNGAGGFELELQVVVVLAGIRKEGSKEDVYRLAEKLVKLGIVDLGDQFD